MKMDMNSDMGWISPDGEWVDVELAEHESFAAKRFPDSTPGEAKDKMVEEGWIEISRMLGFTPGLYTHGKVCTPQQVKTIKEYVKKWGILELVHMQMKDENAVDIVLEAYGLKPS